MSKELAELFMGPRALGLRILFGTVTSVSPLRVLLDSAEADIGPLLKIRGAPDLAERVLVFFTKEGLIVLGKQVIAAVGNLVGLSGASAALSDIFWNGYAIPSRRPHIFRMSDGKFVTVGSYKFGSGTRTPGYSIRGAGAWAAFIDLPAGVSGLGGTSCCQVGDTIYVADSQDAAITKLVYAAGAITATRFVYEVFAPPSTTPRVPFDIVYDSVNNLLHFFYKRNKPAFPVDVNAFILAITPSTMAVAYGPTLVHATAFGGRDGMMAGAGGTMEITCAQAGLAWTVTSTGAAHTITADASFPVAVATGTSQEGLMHEGGTNFTLFRHRDPGGANPHTVFYDRLQRTAGVWDAAWTNVTSQTKRNNSYRGDMGIIRKQNGDAAIMFGEQRVSPTTEFDLFIARRIAGVWGSSALVVTEPLKGGYAPSFAPSDIGEVGTMRFVYLSPSSLSNPNGVIAIDLWEKAIT